MRILVVEDDVSIASLVVEVLSDEFGANVTVFEAHLEALELLRSETFDVIVSDGSFAGWGGALVPGDRAILLQLAAHCPLVVITGAAWAADTEPSVVGAVSIVQKPFDIDQLVRAVAAARGSTA